MCKTSDDKRGSVISCLTIKGDKLKIKLLTMAYSMPKILRDTLSPRKLTTYYKFNNNSDMFEITALFA